MKNFKLMALLAIGIIALIAAATLPKYTQGYYRNAAGTRVGTATVGDSLVNNDTGYTEIMVLDGNKLQVEAKVKKVTGFTRGTAKMLGTNDTNGTWYTLRGDKTQCAACIDSVWIFTNGDSSRAVWILDGNKTNFIKLRWQTDTTQKTRHYMRAVGK